MKKTLLVFSVLILTFSISQAQVQLDATGSGNAFVVTYPAVIVSAPNGGIEFTFKSNQNITGAATLNLNGTGAKPILKNFDKPLEANDIKAGHFVRVIYDASSGGQWQMVSVSANAASSSPFTLTGNNIRTLNITDNIQLASIAGAYMVGTNTGLRMDNINNVVLGNSDYAFSTGGFNNFIGNQAGKLNAAGAGNNFIGQNAGNGNTTGSRNIVIGSFSGSNLGTGNDNIVIGTSAFVNNAVSNSIAIGRNSGTANSNTMSLGGTASTDVLKVGIGIQNPDSPFYVDNFHLSGVYATKIFNRNTNAISSGLLLSINNENTTSVIADFKSGSTSKFLVRSDGNVGIGTTAPGANLHVVGGARITNLSTSGAVFANTNGDLFVNTASGIANGTTNNQMLRWNGTSWVATNSIGSDGTRNVIGNIGFSGVTGDNLQVYGTTFMNIGSGQALQVTGLNSGNGVNVTNDLGTAFSATNQGGVGIQINENYGKVASFVRNRTSNTVTTPMVEIIRNGSGDTQTMLDIFNNTGLGGSILRARNISGTIMDVGGLTVGSNSADVGFGGSIEAVGRAFFGNSIIQNTTEPTTKYGILSTVNLSPTNGSENSGMVLNFNNTGLSGNGIISYGLKINSNSSTAATNFGAFILTNGANTGDKFGIHAEIAGTNLTTQSSAGRFRAPAGFNAITAEGRVRITDLPDLSPPLLNTDGILVSNSVGSLFELKFTGNASQFLSGNGSFATLAANVWTVNGANISNLPLSNNVGIGTNAPNSKLDIAGGALLVSNGFNNNTARPIVGAARIAGEVSAYGALLTGDDGFMRMSAGGGNSATEKTYIDLSGYSQLPDMDKNIVFGVNGTERMRIVNGGNVGIGTNTPSNRLSVVQNVAADNIMSIQNSNASGFSAISFRDNSNAQQMFLGYGNATAPTFANQAYVGTNGSTPLVLAAGGSEKMRIAANGNVGIGTVTPRARLDIGGNISDNVQAVFTSGVNDQNFQLQVMNGIGGNPLQAKLGLFYGSVSGINNASINFYRGGANNDGFLALATLNTDRVTIASNGNVGIGTSTPIFSLDIRNQTNIGNTSIRLNNDNASRLYTGLTLSRQGNEKWFVGMNGSDDNYVFRTNTATDLITINQNGNVGIGTTTPNNPLHINTINNGANWIAGNFGSSTGGDRVVIGNNLGRASIGGHNNALNAWADLTINQAGGNVGIGTGTTAPGYRLEVAGSVAGNGAYIALSDKRFKINITSILKPISLILKTKGVYYDWDTTKIKNFDESIHQIGYLAQDLLTIIPEAVNYDKTKDRYSIAYSKLIPILSEAIKEQQKLIEKLQQENETFKTQNIKLQDQSASMQSEIESIKRHLGLDVKSEK